MQYFPGATLELEAHLETCRRRVKADGSGYGQEAPGTLAGNGSLSVMRKSYSDLLSAAVWGLKSVKEKRLLRSKQGGKAGGMQGGLESRWAAWLVFVLVRPLLQEELTSQKKTQNWSMWF